MSLEKRHEERFQLGVPVLLTNGRGTTRDISRSGIYFLTEQLLAPGGDVQFSVRLDHACPDKQLNLDCRGVVLRVENAGERFGVAASLKECWCTT